MSGYLALLLGILSIIAAGFMIVNAQNAPANMLFAAALFVIAIFLFKGLVVIQPNYSVVLTFFGKYVGTIKDNGLLFVNPLFNKVKYSLRKNNLESTRLKVNDMMGNPIEIAAVIVWQIEDTYRAAFEVDDYAQYIKLQCEAAIRHLAVSFPYDNMEVATAEITLREGGEKVTQLLVEELNERVGAAGIRVVESRISHLAYAAEIAGAMLQRQQASAIVAARTKIVEGAVGMVELALEALSRKEIVHLDEEKKAAMVSNLMVVLCGEKAATPILNTGTLYQ